MDALVGILTYFELDNYDNYVPSSKGIESAFEAKLSLKKMSKKSKTNHQEVKKKKKVQIVILKFLKPYLQGNIPKVEESTEVRFL